MQTHTRWTGTFPQASWQGSKFEGSYVVLTSDSQLLAWEDLVDTATISSKHLATD